MTTASTARIGGVDYAYIEAGEGPLLLFGHGTYGGKELFRPQIDRLSAHFHCVALDWPGHGQSGHEAAGWGVDDLVDAVPPLIRALGHERAFLAGVSQGGAVFMRVALTHPDCVAGLAIMCAGPGAPPPEALARLRALGMTLRDEPDAAVRREAARTFVNAMFHAPGFADAQPDAAERELDLILGHPRDAIALVAGVPASYASVAERLPEIACPTLVVWGDRDLRPQLGAEIAAAIVGAELVVIVGAGHHVNVDAPRETTDALERFFLPLR